MLSETTVNKIQCQSDSSSESSTRTTVALDCCLIVVLFFFSDIALKNMDLNFLLGGVPGILSGNCSSLTKSISTCFCSLCGCLVGLSWPDLTAIPKKIKNALVI
mgnify:CR=1 FL=1